MALLKAVGDILKKLKKPKALGVEDIRHMTSPPSTMSTSIKRGSLPSSKAKRSQSYYRGKKQSEGFKESGHFDRRKSNDRRAETKSAKSNRETRDMKVSALEAAGTATLFAVPAAAGMAAKIGIDKRKKRKLNAKKKADTVNEEKSIEGTYKKYKKSKLRKATAKDRKELADDSRARY